MEYTQYIKPELLVLVPVLLIIGRFLKASYKVYDNDIPFVLLIVSVILAGLYVISREGLSFDSAFISAVQGTLCAGASVFSNQLYVQLNKEKTGK